MSEAVSLKELLKKAKSAIGIHRQVLRWKETFRKGAMGDHDAYNQARDERSDMDNPRWIKLSDVEAFVAVLRNLRNDFPVPKEGELSVAFVLRILGWKDCLDEKLGES